MKTTKNDTTVILKGEHCYNPDIVYTKQGCNAD